jgi:uncharacterized protein
MDPVMAVGLIVAGMVAGILGALFGLGGGFILVPILTIGFGLSPEDAAAVSLVGIVATSVGAASFYLKNRVANIRLGLLLELTTSIGAIAGAVIAAYLQSWVIVVIFSVVVMYSGLRMALEPEKTVEPADGDREHEYTDLRNGKTVGYTVRNVKGGLAVCGVAGIVSSMTGVGGGSIKVPMMNIGMDIPIKAASATSNYMIGITAFSGAMAYFVMGNVALDVAGMVAIGGFLGSVLGTRASARIDGASMRRYF